MFYYTETCFYFRKCKRFSPEIEYAELCCQNVFNIRHPQKKDRTRGENDTELSNMQQFPI